MSPSPAQRAWVERVLGFKFPSELKPTGLTWLLACQAWRAASAAVDAQISALQSVLRKSGKPALVEIAEFGLNAVTGNYKTRLIAMLLELGDGSPTVIAKHGPKARKLLDDFATHITSDPRVAACDENPFGVAVSIRTTIGPALQALQAALQGA